MSIFDKKKKAGLTREEKMKLLEQATVVVPSGVYRCKLVEKYSTTTKTEKDIEKLVFRIIEGEYSSEYLFFNLFLTPKSIKFSANLLRKLKLSDIWDEVKKDSEHQIYFISIELNEEFHNLIDIEPDKEDIETKEIDDFFEEI